MTQVKPDAGFKSLFTSEEVVGGKRVGPNWLKGQSQDQYRTYLHAAFERAQCQLKIRDDKVKVNKDDLRSQVFVLQMPFEQEYLNKQSQQFKTCDPELPDLTDGRKKLNKISRNCTKKNLQRFFQIDQKSEEFKYYADTTSTVPKKAVSLNEVRVEIERFEQLQEKDQRKWAEMESKYRVGIKLKSRKFLPVYYYTNSLHEAKCTQTSIEIFLNDLDLVKEALFKVSNIFQLMRTKFVLDKMHLLRQKWSTISTTYECLDQIKYQYHVDRADFIKLWNSKLVKNEIKPVVEVPKIWSTFKYGQVKVPDVQMLRTYSNMNRGLDKMVKFIQQSKRKRNPSIRDMLQSKIKQKEFSCLFLQYSVHNSIIENMHRLGDIPYTINDVTGQIIRVEGENLILQDKKKHEFLIPVSEICYMASDYGYENQEQNKNLSEQTFRLQLRGRKINKNTGDGENILPHQLGLERVKPSRLTMKGVFRVGLKSLQVPTKIKRDLQATIVNEQDTILLRLRFDIGEFHCYSNIFPMGKDAKIDLTHNLILDLNEAKYIKMTLIALKGRQRPYKQHVNEFVTENEIAWVTLKIRDFEDLVINKDILHTIAFNGIYYNPSDQQIKESKDLVILNAAFIVDSVNGAAPTQEMEGPQLLVGKYVLYQKKYVAKVLKLNRDKTCQIKLLETQPNVKIFKNLIINNASLQDQITLIDKYGISLLNVNSPPNNYVHGLFEWSMDINLTQSEVGLIQKIQEAIQNSQAKAIFQHKFTYSGGRNKNQSFVCGKLLLSLMNAQNLANSGKTLCDTFVEISIQDTKHQSNAKFMDIANEQSFIDCKRNSEGMRDRTIESTIIKGSNNPSWVTDANPQGQCFDLGMFMKKYPHFILIEVYHQKSKKDKELLGFAELHTEDLISLENYGQEFYLFLEDSINKSSIIKLRSLFIPSHGTIERFNLDPNKSIFKNAQQFLFYKVLHMHEAYDVFGYQITLGKYMPESEREDKTNTPAGLNNSIIDANILQKRYEQFSPEHKRHIQLKEQNPFRPKYEENVHAFRQLWLYTQFENRNQALSERQRLFWEQYMNELMSSPLEEGLIEDELKSIRSKLTNTTKMISSKYRKRSKQIKTQGEASTSDGSNLKSEKKGAKFSVIFVGQWEKDQSWKYVDIWYLIKYGIPHDLRVSLWKDLLRRQINEQYEYVFYKKCMPYKENYNGNISNYENMKIFANSRDSMFYMQIEEDVREFVFPAGYQSQQGSREDRIEEERLSMYQIFKVYDLWAHEFSKRRHKIMVYNKGMLAIVQRFLSLMSEEDSFWTLVGMVKAFNNLYSFDFKNDEKEPSQLTHFSPYLTRKVAFKNEMTILNCIIKLHFPLVFDKLKNLGLPIEWYFYESMSQFFAYTFTSELVLRLWDMMIFNLSTNQIDNRKRALWYLLAVPLYMIQMNQEQILAASHPSEVKDLLFHRTASLNYNPNLFIDELLNIIKEVFVKKNTVINKLFKTDKANQLESMRREIELEAIQRYKQVQEDNIKIHEYLHSKEVNLEMDYKAQAYPQTNDFEVVIELIGFRNIFLPQLDEEEASLFLFIQGDERIQTQFEINMPTDIEVAKQHRLKEKKILRTYVQQNKQLQVKLIQIQQEIHQVSLGQGILDLTQFRSYIQENVSVKLFGNKETQNAYIDLSVQLMPQAQQQHTSVPVQGLSTVKNDIYYNEKDEEVKKLIKQDKIVSTTQESLNRNKLKGELQQMLRLFNADESVINSVLGDRKDSAKMLFVIGNLVRAIPQVIKEMNLNNTSELTNHVIQMILMGMNDPINDIFTCLYRIYGNTQSLTTNDCSRILDHIYNIFMYPIPTNETLRLSNYLSNAGYSTNVVKVIQQSIISNDSNLLNMFAKTNESHSYDVTDAFQATLNQVLRLSGLIKEINMNHEPFNNINFWLKQSNNVKKQSQYLLLSIEDNHGDLLQYRFKFNANGYFEPSLPLESILPLRVGGTQALSESQFVQILKEMPLVEDAIRQGKFLQSQLTGTQDVYVDANETHRVVFASIGRKFRFNFTHRIDKENDFTVDISQMMRIAKGNINYLYQKTKQGDEETIDINLSSLSKQDTFIHIKQRMRMILDFIVQAENMADVPNIMSEKYQFKKSQNGFYNALDRLMNVTRDTQFELVRVPQNEDATPAKFDSYALYHHADDSKQWRPCRILMKFSQRGKSDMFKIEYQHEPNNVYQCNREDVLLSLEYKRNQEGYDTEEVKEFLDKLDKEEVEIAQILKEQDKKGLQGAQQMMNQDHEGLKIDNALLDDEKDEEQREINAIMEEDSFDYSR